MRDINYLISLFLYQLLEPLLMRQEEVSPPPKKTSVKQLRLKSMLNKSRNGKGYLNLGIQKIAAELLTLQTQRPLRMKELSEIIYNRFKAKHPDKLFSDRTVQKRLYDAALVLNQVGVVQLKKKHLALKPENSQHISVLLEKINQLQQKKQKIQQKKQVLHRLKQTRKMLELLTARNTKTPSEMEQERIDVHNLIGIVTNKQDITYTQMEIQSLDDIIPNQMNNSMLDESNEIKREQMPFQDQPQQTNYSPCKIIKIEQLSNHATVHQTNDMYQFKNCVQVLSNLQLISCVIKKKSLKDPEN